MKLYEKLKKGNKIKFLVSYYIIFLLVFLISSSMARYTNNISIISKINIAQLDFQMQDASMPKKSMLKSSSKTINNQIIDLSNTVVDDGYGGKLVVPGSKGIITLNLDFSKVETIVDYQIIIDKSNLPDNLKFYVDKDCLISIDDFNGVAKLNDNIIEQKIYWTWEFNDNDEEKYINSNMDIEVRVHIEQKVVDKNE